MKDFFKRHFGLVNRAGFVLVLSLFIILGFFVLAMVAIAIMAAGTDIYVQELNSGQAFYLAEAARNYALEYYLSYGSNFTDTNSYPTSIPTRTLGTGTFTIEIANRQIKTADITFSGIVPTGPEQNITRRIRQSFNGTTNLPSSLNYAFVSLYNENQLRFSGYNAIFINGNSYFNNNTRLGVNDTEVCEYGPTITGDIDINSDAFFGRTTLNGNLRARGNLGTSCDFNSGTYTANGNVSPFPDPPQKPVIEQTYYDNEINRALNNPDVGVHSYDTTTLSSISSALKAEGRNLYVRGTLDIDQSITNGPKNIVTSGGFIEIEQDISVGQRITLIGDKGIATSRGVRIGGTWNGTNMVGAGAFLYASKATDDESSNVILNGASGNWVRVKGAILTPTNLLQYFRTITFSGESSLEGVVYGKGINNFFGRVRGSMVIDGPVYDWYPYTNPFHTIKAANITYDNSLIPLSIKGLYSCSGGDWQELNQ